LVRNVLRASVVALLSSSAPLSATGAEAGHPCAAEVSDAARLACYDAAFGRPEAPAGTRGGSPVVAAAPAMAVTQPVPSSAPASAAALDANPAADFGLSQQAIRARDPEQAEKNDPEQITGTVAMVAYRPRGEMVVTLDNGQVWVQSQIDRKARLNDGDTVTIKKGALASYLLVTPSKVATRVKRVQ
jgi:hypothetical protein